MLSTANHTFSTTSRSKCRRVRSFALLGRNGAGKSTTLKAIMGMLDRTRGSIVFKDRQLNGMRSFEIGRLGIAYCPEERGILASLNVEENLMLPPVVAKGGLTLKELDELFSESARALACAGTRLSGGEQQMLAIARILRTGSRLLLLDEPTEGLAPSIVQQIGVVLRRLKQASFTILLVEQISNLPPRSLIVITSSRTGRSSICWKPRGCTRLRN